ncbi:sugar transferase [Sphingomonas sp. RIT328]|uniref:sugar transferase n=1 Tax=Sphingomonas sp. RIT328 TaxID=1470591 RepID=UPI000452BAE2|nr:sugar transferase [Sphingomonas sp. RIT328]EZP55122.1 Sugar transferase precursor [Sphingomonas sp. RIT328]
MTKRLFDLVVVTIAAVLLSPVFVMVGCYVAWMIGWPILFAQDRVGIGGKVFKMLKFRTMTDARDATGALLPDSDRLPAAGRWLRSTSLDELPEFWNILRGDMALVGPRPLLTRYLPRYTAEQMRRHEVRPGLTGFAQVNGRNALSWDERFALDVWYVDHVSLSLDLKILLLTVKRIFDRQGISAADSVTMSEFMGTGNNDCEVVEPHRNR